MYQVSLGDGVTDTIRLGHYMTYLRIRHFFRQKVKMQIRVAQFVFEAEVEQKKPLQVSLRLRNYASQSPN